MANPPPLQPGLYYHIYNRGNNRENLFREERNYHHFMELHAKYIEPVAETYVYCLLQNHFHWLIRTRELSDALDLAGLRQAFSNCFNAYARSLNNAHQRVGSLFQRPFGRVAVASQSHLLRLVTYVHQNPQRHGLTRDFRAWPWSSYHLFLFAEDANPQRRAVLDWFGGRRAFLRAHTTTAADVNMEWLAPEFD